MTEEIKEILDDVKRHLNYVETTKQSSIRDNEMKAMYNYITNLQKENRINNDLIPCFKNREKELKKQINVLQKENERLRTELNGYKSKHKKAVEYIKIQQKIFKDYDVVSENQLNNLLNILQGGDE